VRYSESRLITRIRFECGCMSLLICKGNEDRVMEHNSHNKNAVRGEGPKGSDIKLAVVPASGTAVRLRGQCDTQLGVPSGADARRA
jgi:hypothetical protein